MNKRALLVWALAVSAGALGCVESQPAVNRVQPNVTRKTDLVGVCTDETAPCEAPEWYFLSTVVDTPYATEFTFVGEQGELDRIEWLIEEDFLVARRTYEYVAGSDPEGINGTTDTAGAPIAMYRIESHFDIRREYNTVTGEELNVIVENTTDRPWYEREYMRVDWSQNLISNPDFMMLARYFDGVVAEPVAWFVQDADDPNAPRFEREDAADESSPLSYMEITNKMMVRPTEVNIEGWGAFPSCVIYQWFDGDPVDCATAEITVRNSFLRIDPEHDYQPVNYTGDRMERFGYFVTTRPGYDPSYGVIEPLQYRFANRHNLWVESHRRDAEGNFVMCTTNAQCADGRGSVCDLDWGRAQRRLSADGHIEGVCTIPYRDRVAQPVVYHLSENWPADLVPEATMLADEYSVAFSQVVGSLRQVECEANSGADCAAERARPDAATMFHVCPSPVPEGAPEACGAPGTIARIGDLRFSILGWVNEPHRSSPLGYGPSAADPVTGEIIAGNAFIYGAGVETVASFGRDIVRLLNGDVTEEEVASGAPVEDWVRRMNASRDQMTTEHDHVVHVDPHRVNEAMDFSWVGRFANTERERVRNPGEMAQRMRDSMERLGRDGAFGNGVDTAATRLSRLRGTQIEQMLTGREARMAAGIDPNLPLSDDMLDAASPLRGRRLDNLAALERMRNRLQEAAGLDFGEFADEGLMGLAREVQRAAAEGRTIEWHGVEYSVTDAEGNLDYEAVRTMLRHPILSGLALHEVGHTVGLRHNFSGSFDAVNYQPEYWALRDDGNMHPRAFDPLTQDEINGRISEYSYSTVMDYGHNFVVTDANGLGHYDHAALKMGYGDLVEVFEDVPDSAEVAWRGLIEYWGWPVPITLDSDGDTMEAYTYTDWPDLVGGTENLERRADVPYTSLRAESLLGAYGIDDRVADAQNRVAVPYLFCSDEQGDLSPGCYRYDAGADAYESVQSVIDSYWNYYIFTNFRRERVGFSVGAAADRILYRYFEKLQRANQTYALYRPIFIDAFGVAEDHPFWTAERGLGGYTMAVGASYQTLLRVVTAPEPGTYGQGVRADGTSAFLSNDDGSEDVDGFDGRYLETSWDFDAGYYWFDQLARVGYFYDKMLAILVLTDPTTYFLGRDTDADIRRYQLNFATTFGPSMTSFFGGLLGEDWTTIAPRVSGGDVTYPDAVEIEDGSMAGIPLSPNASFSIQLYAAVFGMALIPQTYDQDFLNRSRIWVRGGAEEIDVDPTTVIEYTHESSGITYAAQSYVDSNGNERGVGAQILNRAIGLKQIANSVSATPAARAQAQAELDNFIDNIDLIRMLTWHLGFGAQP
jgi:hypothetical protein